MRERQNKMLWFKCLQNLCADLQETGTGTEGSG